jgi:hypothetical protein
VHFLRTCVCCKVPHSRGKSRHRYRKHGLPKWLTYRRSFPAQVHWANCVYFIQCTKSSFEEHFLEHTQKIMSPTSWDEKHLIKKIGIFPFPSPFHFLLLCIEFPNLAFVSYCSLFQSIFPTVSNFSLRPIRIRAFSFFNICLVEIICQNYNFLFLAVRWVIP